MEPIRYYNRLTQRLETEQVYGERWLRLAYETRWGSLLQQVVKKPFFSRWYGRRMARPASRALVAPFIKEFALNSSEFAEPLESFKSFNEFFIRKLKLEARPFDPDPDAATFPCDGRHLGFPNISEITSVFVKGQRFSLSSLLGSDELSKRFAKGSLVLSRLCPTDYHRFHFPAAGIPSTSSLINGALFSVSPIALRRNLSYLWQNKRMITELETSRFGTILMIDIGATNVGSISQTFAPGEKINRGDERGYFSFGGSSTITLFEEGKITLADDLLEQTSRQTELYAPMGSLLGR
ncbi:MAG: archaetidylserine decarboxylase [Roseibacillus sp.]|nr:archaetidylserine decarboxylase [Roseibacillus sp.]